MALKVFSAVVIADTRFHVAPNLNNKTTKEKCDFLEACATHANLAFVNLNGRAVAAPDIQLLVAPEYFFGLPTSDAGNSVRAYDEAAHDDIVRRCTAISARYPKMLMIPGTVLFKCRLTRDQREQTADRLQEKLDRRDAQKNGSSSGLALVKQGRTGIEAVRLKGFGIKEKLGLRDPRLFGYNRAYVYFGGRKIKTFNKAENAAEFSSENPKPTLIPGLSRNVFHYPGTRLRMGLEICADIGRIAGMGERVDIRIIVSAATPVGSGALPTDDTQLLIHAKASTDGARASGAMRATMGSNIGAIFQTLANTAPVANNLRCQMVDLNATP